MHYPPLDPIEETDAAVFGLFIVVLVLALAGTTGLLAWLWWRC